MKRVNWLIGLAGIAVIFSLVLPCESAEKAEIKIGLIRDLTGATAATGIASSHGWLNFIDYINEKGGVKGYKIDLKMMDGKESITEETRAFNELRMWGAVAIYGWSTPGTMALREAAKREKITYFGHTCSRTCAMPKEYPYTFIFAATYVDQINLALQYIKDQGAKNFVFLRDDIEAWKTTEKIVKETGFAEKIGLTWLETVVEPIKATDVTPQMNRIKKLDPDFIICPNTPDTFIPTLRDGVKVGIPASKIVGATLWSMHPTIPEKLGKAAEGNTSVQVFPIRGMDNTINREIAEYVKTNAKADKWWWDGQYVQAWMQARLFCSNLDKLIENNGGKTPEDLATFRIKFKEEMEGLQGHVMGEDLPAIDMSDHKGWPAVHFYKIKDGKYVPTGDWIYLKK